MSQDTVQEAIKDAMAPKEPKKTGLKRYKSKPTAVDSNSQPVPGTKSKPPHRVMDRLPIIDWHSVHHMGKAMMLPRLVNLLTGDMRSLHEGVLYNEERLLKEEDPTYPVFHAKVPEIDGLGFVTKDSEDVIVLRFNDIFNMYHMYALHPSIVRLVALSMAHQILKENTPA